MNLDIAVGDGVIEVEEELCFGGCFPAGRLVVSKVRENSCLRNRSERLPVIGAKTETSH